MVAPGRGFLKAKEPVEKRSSHAPVGSRKDVGAAARRSHSRPVDAGSFRLSPAGPSMPEVPQTISATAPASSSCFLASSQM
eukprot:CAMPEP_0170595898 /NCGR_PEP_ID=MMETSP0224-20130122/14812_1 /TAXON_ID=285029 /ORGANISM="Togula jolla, Strain CCCM 725" /LENGTH=80 /DNA_ID=CAMNT_0010920119 /DNA_START=41 /DNA_END=280 /DNA_ORIENTATION=-